MTKMYPPLTKKYPSMTKKYPSAEGYFLVREGYLLVREGHFLVREGHFLLTNKGSCAQNGKEDAPPPLPYNFYAKKLSPSPFYPQKSTLFP